MDDIFKAGIFLVLVILIGQMGCATTEYFETVERRKAEFSG